MRLPHLNDFDNITAAGILARAALALDDSDNPAAAFSLPDEKRIREEIMSALSRKLGISAPILSATDIERMGEEIDQAAEELFEPIDSEKVLNNLSIKGELPTDLYSVIVDPQVLNNFSEKNRAKEEYLVTMAVRYPDQEHHFSPEEGLTAELPLVSLFSRYYENKFSQRSFTMLVSGVRNGLLVQVNAAWRIYADFKGTPSKTLLELLKRFAENFGLNIKFGSQVGKFCMSTPLPSDKTVTAFFEVQVNEDPDGPLSHEMKKVNFMSCYAEKRDPAGLVVASLIYAINLDRYRKLLDLHGIESEKLEDILVDRRLVTPTHASELHH